MTNSRFSPAILIAGGASFDIIVHLEHFPDPRPGVVSAREGYQTLGGTSAGKTLNLSALCRPCRESFCLPTCGGIQ